MICKRDNDEDTKASVCFNPVLSSFSVVYCTCKRNDTAAHHCLPMHFFVPVITAARVEKKGEKYTPREKVKLQWRYRRNSRRALFLNNVCGRGYAAT